MKFAFYIILSSLLILQFQNCKEVDTFTPVPLKSQVVLFDEATYERVEFLTDHFSQDYLVIDLVNMQIEITIDDNKTTTTCNPENDVLLELKSILTNAEICEPAPLEEGAVSCLAYPVPSIGLTNTQGEEAWLAGPICRSGVFLCNEEHQKILLEIKQHFIENLNNLSCQ